jgi:GTP-binding protein HflX
LNKSTGRRARRNRSTLNDTPSEGGKKRLSRGGVHMTRSADGRDVQELRDRVWKLQRLEERCILVGVVLPPSTRAEQEEHLDELERLASTAGATSVGRVIQERSEQNVRTFIGSGKLEELVEMCDRLDANLVIFDEALSPAQARNLEAVLQRNVIDRTELILDIFARHARSREAKLQVELAQLEYMRPRLRKLWDHLSRQDGGIGTRGPGETQLEVDRRRVDEKLSVLRRHIRERGRVVETQRKSRRGIFHVALVGYTNAGKSSLMNALAGSELLTQDKLFSTLDATTRRVSLAPAEEVLMTDTVGFIRKLPHDLVASFQTTLAEINHADLILHVSDITSGALAAHIQTVHEVMEEIVKEPRETLMVFNKIDKLQDSTVTNVMLRHYPRAVFTSARSGAGLEDLRAAIHGVRRSRTVDLVLETMGAEAQDALSFCYREGRVERQETSDNGNLQLQVNFPEVAFRRFMKLYSKQVRILDLPLGEEPIRAIDPLENEES